MLRIKINNIVYKIALSVVVICLTSFFYLSNQKEITQKKELEKTSNILAKILEQEIDKTLSIQQKIGDFLIDKDSVWHFDLKTARYFEQYEYLIALELAPNGVIKYVEPLRDNFLIMGYDLLSDSSQTELIQLSIKNHTPHFIGPIDFKQGGKGIISRLPIYKKNKFIGFSIALIDTQKLLLYLNVNEITKDISSSYISDEYLSLPSFNGACIKQSIFTSQHYNLTLNCCY